METMITMTKRSIIEADAYFMSDAYSAEDYMDINFVIGKDLNITRLKKSNF